HRPELECPAAERHLHHAHRDVEWTAANVLVPVGGEVQQPAVRRGTWIHRPVLRDELAARVSALHGPLALVLGHRHRPPPPRAPRAWPPGRAPPPRAPSR